MAVGLLAVTVALSAPQLAAGASPSDGVPVVRGVWPPSGGTAGGAVVRIYGRGLEGTTEVSFGTQSSPSFKVIDSNLVTAMVPPAAVADGTAVDVTATDGQGTSVVDPASDTFLFTDGTMTLNPTAGLSTGAALTASVTGFVPGFTGAVAEVSPLLGYVEGAPPVAAGPPPYEDQNFVPVFGTDTSGRAAVEANLPAFGGSAGYDPQATCSVSQEAADFGVGHCGLALTGPAGAPYIERSFGLVEDPVPAAPTLTVSPAADGRVTVTGRTWNAAPRFGSAATPDSPGQTGLSIELCSAELGDCRALNSDATVAMTRYTDTDRTAGVQGRFRGATLAGTAAAGDTAWCGDGCTVRVTQQAAQAGPGEPAPAAVSAVAPLSLRRPGPAAAAAGASGAAVTGVDPAPAADGRPFVARFWPESGPTAGGRPVRIYGSGFGGTTKVTFGTKPARFAVVDSHLLTAVAPPVPGGADNSSVAITVTDADGASNAAPGFLFSDVTLTVDPDGGLTTGAAATVTAAGYKPDTPTTIDLASPLAAFLEDGPAAPDGTTPYRDRLGTALTDATGASSTPVTLPGTRPEPPPPAGTPVTPPDPPPAPDAYDPNRACPPTQEQADAGLVSCSIVYGSASGATLAHDIRYTGQPLPNAGSQGKPVLTTVGSAHLGDRIAISGTGWNAAPQFGSSTTPLAPGQTRLSLQLCKYQGACSPATGTATVDMTRYRDTTPGDATVEGELSGATLSGTLLIDNISGCLPTCTVQVLQQAFDAERGVAVDTTIGASTLLRLTDGPPLAVRPWPQTSPTAGGGPVRIYGRGLSGVTSVTFGTVESPGFKAIDSGLIAAIVPPAAGGTADDNTSVTVTDEEGTFTADAAFDYTDASLTVTPATGLAPAATATVEVKGYKPSAPTAVAEASPLLGFVENGPAPPAGPAPYRADLATPVTDPAGNSTSTGQLRPAGAVGPPGYDAGSTCPVTQEEADFGLGRCQILYDQAGTGGLVEPIALSGDPVPAKPTLTLSPISAFDGDTIAISGTGWNAAPEFGSFDANFATNDVGITPMTVDVCTADLSRCTNEIGVRGALARVSPTRYTDTDPTDAKVEGAFSGGVLTGAALADNATSCAPDCVVRVRQQRFDPVRRAPADDFIEATAPLRLIRDTPQNFVGYTPFSGQAGTRVVLYGRGAPSLTGVDFGGMPGTDVSIGAGDTVVVTVPEGPAGLLDLTLHGGPNDGLVIVGGFFIRPTDFSYTVEPVTGLHTGDTVRVTVHHYIPDAFVILALTSPLINFIEPPPGVAPANTSSIPPQVSPIFPAFSTDAGGNGQVDVALPDLTKRGDTQARCGISQKQADHGLDHCILALSLFSQGIVEVPLGYADDAAPSAPFLNLRTHNAQPGDRVDLTGFTWHGNPHPGSSQAAGDLHVDICGVGGVPTACRAAAGNVTVSRTRYVFDPADFNSGQLSGADLSGSITVPDVGRGDCGTCVVRVRQDVAGTATFLEATSPLSIRGQPVVFQPQGRLPVTPQPQPQPRPRPGIVTPLPLPPARPPVPGPTNPPPVRPPGNALTPSPAPNPAPQPPPPPVPPSGAGAPGARPGVAPTPGQASAPTPGQASAPTPGQANAPSPGQANAPSPGASDVGEDQVQGAGSTRHLMVRHEPAYPVAGGAQAAAAVAAAGAGCFLMLGVGSPLGRRRRTSIRSRRAVPEPRGGY